MFRNEDVKEMDFILWCLTRRTYDAKNIKGNKMFTKDIVTSIGTLKNPMLKGLIYCCAVFFIF